MLVAYGSTTLASNYIYAYDVNATTGALSAATLAYSDPAVVNGPTALLEDPVTGDVLVANGLNTFNTISVSPSTR